MTNQRRTSCYRLRPLLIATTLAASSVVLAAAPSLSATTATTKPVPKAAGAKAANPLPVMNVTDVKTGKSVALASFVNGTRPVLVWFWAPH